MTSIIKQAVKYTNETIPIIFNLKYIKDEKFEISTLLSPPEIDCIYKISIEFEFKHFLGAHDYPLELKNETLKQIDNLYKLTLKQR